MTVDSSHPHKWPPSLKKDTPWRVVGASVRGDAHRSAATPCQDYHTIKLLGRASASRNAPKDIIIACVADGAGSAHQGHHGARLMAQTMVSGFCRGIGAAHGGSSMEDDTTMTHHLLGLATKNLEATHKKFQDGARRLKTSPEAMATTFCLLVVTPGWYFGCQVGDGTIVTRRRGAPDYATLLQPTKGDHANETTLFPQNIAKQTSEGWIMDTSHLSLRFERESLDFFCLSTDGIDTVAFLKPQWQPSSGFFKPLEDHARETTSRRKLTQDLHQFLKSSSLRRRSDDDRTMVIGCHKEPT